MKDNETFSAALTARRVLRLAATGSLATLRESGAPFASFVTVATTPAGAPILLLSRLAVHTGNLDRDARASLLLVAPGGESGDPLAGARLTLVGSVSKVVGDPILRRRFLARHEDAVGYADFGDFAFYQFAAAAAHLVAGFGRIVDLAAEQFLTDCSNAKELIEAEESAIAHMNADHAGALSLIATRLLGMPEGRWRLTGVDPAGIDLRAGPLRARLDFEAPVATPDTLRRILASLASGAREG
jgi:putative heme iron utilization protein